MALIALPASKAFTPLPAARAFHRAIPLMSEDMKTGTVKWFNSQKGFGFIIPTDGSSDVFVHQTSIVADGFRSLADGEEVEFKVIEDNDGKTKAVDVTGPGGEPVKGAPFQPRDDYNDGY
ncbi:hypothetical protein TrRE_jg12630 [Triparma retinervis]|uniref:CSD domain-containing protein n=1 Tax=Triparma retinervis TaxID=2557542 RepID=A0A9W6ZCK2_9STRA|nr:hypothetical protein TrRE_jg12630 [Triparma retinervis]